MQGRILGTRCAGTIGPQPSIEPFDETLSMTLRSKLLRAALLAATLGMASFVHADTPPINYADHWQKSDEPGWGLGLTQNGDVLFGVLYIYDTGSLPTWYAGTLNFAAENGGTRSYTGTLYKTSGPALGQPFNPALVTYTAVGTITIEFPDDAHGLLTYTINGLGATKSITRFTYAANSITGEYVGSTSDVTYDCANPERNGEVTDDPGPFTIAVENGEMVMRFPTCTVNGTYTQQGQIGQVEGPYGCTHGGNGTIKFTGLRAEKGGIVGSYEGRDDFSCKFRGNLGGMRKLQ